LDVEQLTPSSVRVSFDQKYESAAYVDSVNKVLEMKLENDQWKITREYNR
jgi:hypothetical protein